MPQSTSPASVSAQSDVEKMGRSSTWVRIDHAALRHNFEVSVDCEKDAGVLAMVKADAYGHGAVEVCQTLALHPALAAFGVAIVDEGIELRKAGIQKKIIVHAGACWLHRISELISFDLEPVVSSFVELQELQAQVELHGLASPLEIHLALDTGMAREGVLVFEGEWHDDHPVQAAQKGEPSPSFFEKNLQPIFDVLKDSTRLKLASVFTHFANADQARHRQNTVQRRRFEQALSWMRQRNVLPDVIHFENSAALLEAGFAPQEDTDLKAQKRQWTRPGICLYGADPQTQKENRNEEPALLQVMHWYAPVVGRKRVPKDTPVSYGGHFVTTRDTELAILRVGYADGYLRSMSGQASVLIAGRRAPVLGTICMDMVIVDVTEHIQHGLAVELQDRATLLGEDPDYPEVRISLDEMAAWRHTIPYEVTCGVSARVPKVHVQLSE